MLKPLSYLLSFQIKRLAFCDNSSSDVQEERNHGGNNHTVDYRKHTPGPAVAIHGIRVYWLFIVVLAGILVEYVNVTHLLYLPHLQDEADEVA